MDAVREYEFHIKITQKRTRAVREIVKREWAYSLSDARDQAIFNMVSAEGISPQQVNDYNFEFISMGPPVHLIELAAKEVEQFVDAAMTKLLKDAK